MPYWGMRGGDLMEYLKEQGFSCYAASVAPTGSAWDRACELYAQLAGTRVDYGKAHSEKYRHDRFGTDYTGRALIPDWGPETRIVLLGHSFGGVTVRLFSELLANGDPAERAADGDGISPGEKEAGGDGISPGEKEAGGDGISPEEKETGGDGISPLFQGGMGERVCGIVTLAAPTNGTTAYDLFQDPSFHPEKVKVPWWSKPLANMMSKGTRAQVDGRDVRDYAGNDMQIDNAIALNQKITTFPHVYYFSVPCSFTVQQPDGTHKPKKKMEPLFVMRAYQIGAYKGRTAGGMEIDEAWRENDGLVNTFSAAAPIGAPSKPLKKDYIEPGIWNVFPAYDGDHMALQGGLMKKHNIRNFYLELLQTIDGCMQL